MTVIDVTVPPSGTGCVECAELDGWWVHLRRCATCGHVGCCDSSLGRHATEHFHATGHPIMQSFEPGEEWFWDFRTAQLIEGPALAPPDCRPADASVPGPLGRVPADWRAQLAARDARENAG